MKTTNEVKIPGVAIASSIEIMAALGPIGKRVLIEQGIKEIDPKKQYSYKIRTTIFDEICTRFGNEALTAFGFENYLKYDEFVAFTKEFQKKNNHLLTNPLNHFENLNIVEKLMFGIGDMLNNVLSKNFKSKTSQASVKITKISPTTFIVTTIVALKLEHHTFIRGAWWPMLLECVGNVFSVDFIFNKKKSETLNGGWVKMSFDINFSQLKKIRNKMEFTKNERFKANEALLRSVLIDSEKQKLQIEKLSSQLSKYVPPQIHQALISGNYDTKITTKRKKLTIFFSDIINFTSTSEDLQPEDLTKYLNEYFSEMTTIALNYGATIDKYIGDAMMVFFGDPETKGEREDARSCVEMALSMQARMSQLQEKWLKQGFANPFKIRMGINTGFCNVGNFGSDQRLTYTIIGGEVNIAQRLESAAIANGILMSYETYAHAEDKVNVEQLEAIKMKGINREINIFSVLSRKQAKISNNIKTKNIKKEEDKIYEPEIILLEKNLNILGEKVFDIEKKIDFMIKKIGLKFKD